MSVTSSASTAGGGPARLSTPDPRGYRPHPLHDPARNYPETNCWSDVIIELLHARGYEPLAAFAHLVRIDFEGDQWTFFKPPADDLEALFGVDVHEMQPYRPLPTQIAEQLALGRSMIVEVDSWFLPDLAASSYRSEHVKTAIAADAIDPERQVLRYFHGPGRYELEGEDYRGALRLGRWAPEALPPYAELVRFDAGPRLEGEELRRESERTLRRHLGRRPAGSPFERFAAALERALPTLLAGDLAGYHAYAFATVRMLGSACEVLASYCEWLLGARGAAAATALIEVVEASKALSFRLARRRAFEPRPALEGMARSWERALGAIEGALD